MRELTKKEWLDYPPYIGPSIRDIGMTFRHKMGNFLYLMEAQCGPYNPETGEYEVIVNPTLVKVISEIPQATKKVFKPTPDIVISEIPQATKKVFKPTPDMEKLYVMDKNYPTNTVQVDAYEYRIKDIICRRLFGKTITEEEAKLVEEFIDKGGIK